MFQTRHSQASGPLGLAGHLGGKEHLVLTPGAEEGRVEYEVVTSCALGLQGLFFPEPQSKAGFISVNAGAPASYSTLCVCPFCISLPSSTSFEHWEGQH